MTADSMEARACETRWKKCSLAELIGADYALRIFRTSPILRGEALKICEMLINQVREEINSRPEECKKMVSPEAIANNPQKLVARCPKCKERMKQDIRSLDQTSA